MSEEAILIAGPTACGKSALALALARERGGVVVNADSMQVYRDLRALTARPSEAETALAEHRLYGHVDGGVNYSVGRYLADMTIVVDEARAAGRPLIVVGGTGLYFKALIEGLSTVPPVPDEVRAAVRAAADGVPTPTLHAGLALRDPEGAARLQPNDRQRILRALEVWGATGRPLGAFRENRIPGPLATVPSRRIVLAQEREPLRRQIEARFEAMIDAGALEEVRALADRGLDPALPIMRAHGVPALLAHLRGELTLAEAIARGQADTRAYAKRQLTWCRHQMPGWQWLAPGEARDLLGT